MVKCFLIATTTLFQAILSAHGLSQHESISYAAETTITNDGDYGQASNAEAAHSIPSRHRRLLAPEDAHNNATDPLITMTVRGGVLVAPPFATYEPERDGENVFGGFQGDLLRRLQSFARTDGYDLRLDLDLSPEQQYGAALDLVANDCNTTINPNTIEDCERYDFIVGDYYCNGPRSIRVDFSPTWLRTTMSTVKTVKDPDDAEAQSTDFTTLTQLQEAGGTACVPEGTYLREVVMGNFPRAQYVDCPSPDKCIQWLKQRRCSLYADDELALRYRALDDPALEVTGEQFNTQYIVWPIRYSLEPEKSLRLKKWMYDSVSNATLDLLSYKYFTLKLCPLGRAGKNCDKNCDPKHGASDRLGRCICHSTKWSGDDCSVEVEENLNLYPEWEIIVCYAFFAINALACVLCAGWIYWKRSNDLVKVSQPYFLNLVLLGCAISSSSILPLVQQSEGNGSVPACYVFPWLYCVGFSVSFGTLFAKIRRIYKVIRASAHAVRIVVTQKETLIAIGVITSVDVVICATWTAVDRLRWVRVVISADQFGEPLESAGYCTSDHWKVFLSVIAVWHLILLCGGCWLCYLTRNISPKLVESKYLPWAMVSHLQIYVISIPVLILVGTDPKSSLFIRAVVIWINDLAIIVIIFGSLIYSVHNNPGGNLDINQAISTYVNRTNLASHAQDRVVRPLQRSSTVKEIRMRVSRGHETTVDEWDENANAAIAKEKQLNVPATISES